MPQLTAILRRLNPLEWAGPIFTKELRVTSRRKRFYVLRFVYLLVMIGFVGLIEFPAGESVASSVIGRTIVKNIIWFEFIACQVLAVVLTCNAVSGEITAGTLGVLMTTPIPPFQIVLGKLLSRLLQIFLLLAITLPLLAAVRVFGGVPWDSVVYSLLLIAAASLLAGSISVFFSCLRFGPIGVIVFTLIVYGTFLLLPALGIGTFWIMNPVQSMQQIWADPGFSPGDSLKWGSFFSDQLPAWMNAVWNFLRVYYATLNIAAMLGLSLLVLFLASRSVGKLAKWAANQSPTSRVSNLGARPGRLSKATRSVSGSALLWKEMRFYVPDSRRKTLIAAGVALAILIFSYVCAVVSAVHYEAMLHMLYLMLYLLGIWLFCLILSCTAITVERESRALPILLTAPVSDAQIIWAKTASVFRRVGPLGALMLAHLIVFTILPSIHPLGMLYMSLIALYSSVFIVCLGMYCSALTRTSTASIILALALLLAFWLALPMVVNVATDLAGPTLWEYGISQPAQFLGGHLPSTFNSFNALNPLVQMSVMITSTCGEEKARLHPNLLEYRWMASYGRPGNGAAGVIVGSLLLYASLSAWLLWRAKIRLRKNVFVG